MDPVATYSREITGNRFNDNTTIHQGDINHYHSSNDKTREDEDTKCLTDLRTTDPRDDKTRIEATKGGLFKDSYRWILEHSDFRQWRDDECSRLLWIKGDPGKGKTMLLCGIVNELSSGTRLKDQKANTLLSYFFCQAADERINSATAVLRGLIYLVVKQQPLLVSHIQEKYKDGGEAIFKDVNAWTALSEILTSILEDESLDRTYVIIDALDECVTDLPKLLDFISTKSTLFSRVKWIVSSRNWPDIEERLDSTTQQMSLCLELNEKSISAAVNAYIEHRVKQLAQKRKYNARIKNAVQHHLSFNSNNTFLWVALVCQNLEKISLQNTLLKLNEFPPGLNSLYKRMIQQIQDLEDVNDAKFCYQILATVLLVYRPVTLAELGTLVGFPDDNPTDAESIYKAIRLCGSFLTVRDSRVFIIHQSAKDYLSDKAGPTIFPFSSADVHSVIFGRSLRAMSATLQRNIYNLYPPGLPINEIKAPNPDPLAAIQYSCVHWVDHFCDMHNSNSQSQDQVDDKKCQTVFLFLRKYFLYWLEALGLIGCIKDGVFSMARLENLLKGKSLNDQFQELTRNPRWFYPLRLGLKSLLRGKSPDRRSLDCQLLKLAQDSGRFIRQNSSLIEDSPLQVYTSALIFSPLNSLIRKMFKGEELQWLKVKSTVEYNWSPYLQTLKGHSGEVFSVAFSVDGSYLASGSGDKTIKIWDAATGKERQTLKDHSDWVNSVAFSADSRYLASGSYGTIKIWDATTGKERQTLKGHRERVSSVAFSADGRYLASGSWDMTIKIWDIATGKERQILKGHRGRVSSVAFSADGRYLASGSLDHTIKIWDVTTGKERQTLKRHRGSVSSVTFSADGRYLASGSWDKSIKIWDATTGKERQILKGHSCRVSSVAFSADSRYLASGSWGQTVKIWDVMTGKKQQTLRGHSGSVSSVAFSADGRYLASGSRDKTIKIWDVTMGKEQKTLKDYSYGVFSVAFSANGRCLALGLLKTIKIWDMTTGKELQSLKGHSYGVLSVAFSANSRHLASGSWDKTIKIWDMTTGKERQTLKVNAAIHTLSFDDTASYLYTEIGTIKLGREYRTEAQYTMIAQVLSLDSSPAQDQGQRRLIANDAAKTNHFGYGLSSDKCWITWNEHKILWLPPEYRPSKSAISHYAPPSTSPRVPLTDVVMALGNGSGRVVVFRMSGSGPYSLL